LICELDYKQCQTILKKKQSDEKINYSTFSVSYNFSLYRIGIIQLKDDNFKPAEEDVYGG